MMIHPILPMLFAAFLQVGTAGAVQSEPWSVKQLVEYHQSTKQSLQVQDVYKLLYQADFGNEHVLSDPAGVLAFLQDELASLDTFHVNEPLLERISTTDEIVRVNLRPYKALNLEPSVLVEMMFRSAEKTKPDTFMFYRQWNGFSALVRYGLLDFPAAAVKDFDQRITEGKLDPVHHSEEYRALNRPAYRVVRRALFEQRFGNLQEGK